MEGKGIQRIRDSVIAKSSRKLPVSLKPDVKKSEVKNKDGRCKCTSCGKSYASQAVNFFQTKSPLFKNNNGRLPFCKDCAEEFYGRVLKMFDGDEMRALEYCCHTFDWYYNPDLANEVIHSGMPKRLGVYFSKMTLPQYYKLGTRYSHTIKEMMESDLLEETDKPSGDAEGEVEWRTLDQVPQSVSKFFGAGYRPNEYMFLNNQYQDWAKRYECKTKAQEELFKSLAISQLVIQRVQKSGSAKEISDAMKTFQDLLGTANLKPAQSGDSGAGDAQQPFGVWAKKYENERPVPEPLEEWKDIDGIHRELNTFFLGHFCKLLHVTNDYELQYEEEMEKYTVKPPAYEEEEEGETSILDKYSDRGQKSDDQDKQEDDL